MQRTGPYYRRSALRLESSPPAAACMMILSAGPTASPSPAACVLWIAGGAREVAVVNYTKLRNLSYGNHL